MSLASRVDHYQREHRWAGFSLAVVYKFVDDLGSYQAALLTYYAFVSLFPLLLLAVTVLGFVLSGNPGAQQEVLNSALRDFPVIGQEIGANVHALHGSVWAIVVGVAVSLYGGLGVTQAGVTTMCQIWAIPVAERPGLAGAYGRGATVLLVVGGGVLLTTALSGFTTDVGAWLPAWANDAVVRLAPVVVAVVLNTVLFVVAYQVLTPRPLPWRLLLPGAVVAAVSWQVLQLVGTYLVAHELQGTSASYGLFGIVLGLLAWLYLGAVITVLGAQINAVRVLGLAPRSLLSVAAPDDPEVTAGDRRAYRAYATSQRRKTFQSIAVAFHPRRVPTTRPAAAPADGAEPAQLAFDELAPDVPAPRDRRSTGHGRTGWPSPRRRPDPVDARPEQ
jgi:membrane protein